jgi:hypothetical protein
MARRIQRVPEPPSSRVVVPADIAAGPEIRRWASQETLDVMDRLRPAPAGKGSPQQLRDANGDAMVSAYCRWRDARNAWFSEAGLTLQEGLALLHVGGPYWSTPDEP